MRLAKSKQQVYEEDGDNNVLNQLYPISGLLPKKLEPKRVLDRDHEAIIENKNADQEIEAQSVNAMVTYDKAILGIILDEIVRVHIAVVVQVLHILFQKALVELLFLLEPSIHFFLFLEALEKKHLLSYLFHLVILNELFVFLGLDDELC